MPSLEQAKDNRSIKMMVVGNSGAGKTGALVSLVKEGYKLRIYDLDNGLDSLIEQIKEQCPDKMGQVEFMRFRDKFGATNTGIQVKGSPKAYTNLMLALDKWEDGSVPEKWGEDVVVVIESLSAVGRAAFYHARHLNPTAKEPRTWYNAAQEMVFVFLENLTSEAFGPNVIVNTHIDLREQKDGTVQGFPSSIGEAIGPKIPSLFNTLVLAETSGTGAQVKRQFRTQPTALVGTLKFPKTSQGAVDINTALATFFKTLKG